jgi:hypothetical protein
VSIYDQIRAIRNRIAARCQQRILRKLDALVAMHGPTDTPLDEGRSPYAITVGEFSWSVTSTKNPPHQAPITVPWLAIRRVTAFKQDLFVVDLICLSLELNDGRTVNLNEETQGFQAFSEALPRYLLGARAWESWWPEVAFPAFATNVTPVFERREGAA